jgi:hypothetical protein
MVTVIRTFAVASLLTSTMHFVGPVTDINFGIEKKWFVTDESVRDSVDTFAEMTTTGVGWISVISYFGIVAFVDRTTLGWRMFITVAVTSTFALTAVFSTSGVDDDE